MGIKDILAKLKGFFSSPSTEYVQNSRDFLRLDHKQLVRREKYDKRGKERGKQNLPPSNITQLDEVERDIKARFEGDIAENHEILDEELSVFSSRVGALRLNQVPNLQGWVTEVLGDYRTEKDNGTNDLSTAEKHVKVIEKSLNKFEQINRRAVPAMYPESKVLHFAFIFALMAIETVLNGVMIGLGAAGGLTEGVLIAFGIALVNVFILGGFLGKAFSWAHHVYFPKRFFGGVIPIIFWTSLLIFLNFGVAHYRDAIQNVKLPIDQASAIALERVVSMQLPVDVESGFLFIAGILFGLLAGFDWLKMDDPYPGYGRLSRRCDREKRNYGDKHREVLARLGALYVAGKEGFETTKDELERREIDYKDALGGRERKIIQFKAAEAHNLSVAQQVVEIYRDENRKARSTPPPTHFDQELQITTQSIELSRAGELSIAEVERQINWVVERIELGINELDQAWKDAQNEFENLRQLTD